MTKRDTSGDVKWTTDIRKLISEEMLKRWPRKFATTRAVYYWLGSINRTALIPKVYKKVNALLVRMRKENDPKLSDRENIENGCIPWGYFPVIRGTNGPAASDKEDPKEFFERYQNYFLHSDHWYEMPRWYGQDYHVEAWVEKLGLLDDIEHAVRGLDIQCRAVEGFPPWEFVHENIRSIRGYLADRAEDAKFVILYLGDLDPSGRDIPRQLVEALNFFGIDVELRWVCLLPDHVFKYTIPELPIDQEVLGKIHRDARYKSYMDWLSGQGIDREIFAELDAVNAVNPEIITNELRPIVAKYYDRSLLPGVQEQFDADRSELQGLLREAAKKLGQ